MIADKKIVVFDLHGTLSEGKEPIDNELVMLLNSLLKVKDVGITSGYTFRELVSQVSSLLNKSLLSKLYLLPVVGTEYYKWEEKWVEVCSDKLTDLEKIEIYKAFNSLNVKEKTYGELYWDKGCWISYGLLGLDAPLSVKQGWDEDFSKRLKLKRELERLLPDLEVVIGGHSTISVAHKNCNKTIAIKRINDYLGYKNSEILYVANAFFEGGDDYCIKEMGIDCIEVSNPEETKWEIKRILNEVNCVY